MLALSSYLVWGWGGKEQGREEEEVEDEEEASLCDDWVDLSHQGALGFFICSNWL